jgi:hypothetical protein
VNDHAIYAYFLAGCYQGYKPLVYTPRVRADVPWIEALSLVLQQEQAHEWYEACRVWVADNALE